MSGFFQRIIIILLIIFIFFYTRVDAEQIGSLEDILKPRSLIVHKGKAYITEKESIHIVSIKSGKLLKSFGRKGEGPGEFKRAPNIRIINDRLIVNSWGKIMYYDLDGNCQKERKHQFGRDTGAIPLKENFAAQSSDFSEEEQIAVQEFGLYDRNFKLMKKMFHGPSPNELDILPGNRKQPYPMITENISMDVYEGCVYISDTRKGFYFQVFDSNGARMGEIKVERDAVKVGNKYKLEALEELKSGPWWNRLKDKLEPVFPENFPEIKFFTIRNNKIFVESFITKGENSLFRIYDLKTKMIQEVYLPSASQNRLKRYDIHDGIYYYLTENKELDNWELHRTGISQ